MIQLANYEEREFYVMLGQVVTTCDIKFIFQMTEQEFEMTLTPVSSTTRATKFAFTATGYPEGQYIVQFNVSGSTLATVAGFVTGNPIFATSQYNTYNDDGTSTTYVPSDDQGLVPSVSQKLRVSTIDQATDVSYVRYLKVTNGTLTDNGDNSVTLNTSGVDTLEDLTDVDIVNVENNQIIQYQGYSLPGSPAGWKNRVLQWASLSDTKGVPTEGKYAQYIGGFWQPVDLDLNDLSDVTISGSPISGSILRWSSTFQTWYNEPYSPPSPPPSTTDGLPEGSVNLYYTEARVSANSDVVANTAKVGVISGGTTGQALVKSSGTDYDVEWADIAVDVQYHDRYATQAETLRAGGTETIELYYSAQADGDGLAESASSDTPTSGYDIRRKLWYAEKAQADPDTSGDWTQFTAIADNTTFADAKAALLAYLKERTGGTVPISLKMTWEEVSQTAYLLDQSYGSGAAAAYSVRRLNGNYTGAAIEVERSSDNQTQDIGFDANGDLDESALTTFCTGTVCKVRTWYDQSQTGGTGSGNDAVQTTHANQPTIYTGGAIVKDNGRVALTFTDSTNFAAVNITGNSAVDFFNVFSSSDTRYIFNGGSGRFSFAADSGSTTAISSGFGTPTYKLDGTSVSMTTRGQGHFYTSTGSRTLLNAAGDASNFSDYSIIYRSQIGDSFNLAGNLQETLYFNTDKSTDRTSIESNIGDYYTQNTPLLDTYSGAAAAYSLRLLDSTYTGALVEVYNGSSYADIGFNVFGELDTVALAAHCGASSGYVSKWYDQSGNGNTATQATTASMPKIYDGTTGVVTENGKPAVEFNGTSSRMTSAMTVTSDFTTSVVLKALTASQSNQWLLQDTSGTDMLLRQVTTNFSWYDGTVYNIGTAGTDQHHIFVTANSSGSVVSFDGADQSISAIGNNGYTDLEIGGDSGSRWWHGRFQEIVIYGSYQSDNRTGIEDNINTFYNIY